RGAGRSGKRRAEGSLRVFEGAGMRTQPIFALVNSGFQVADFPALHGAERALYVPAVDSCTAALRASWDQTSANYLPVKYNAVPASGQALSSLQDVTIPMGPGGAVYALDYNVAAAP